MSSPIVRAALATLALGIALAAGSLLLFRAPELPVVAVGTGATRSPDPVPWREPEADIRRFFPGATAHREEVRILSGARPELIRRLGRQPAPEEHLAVIHRVLDGSRCVGEVMVRRVRGVGGAIEVVLAVRPDGRVRGVRLQRHREPGAVAAVLESPRWLGAFVGRTAASDWHADRGPLAVPEPARESAAAIVEAVRSLLIVREIARSSGLPAAPGTHH